MLRPGTSIQSQTCRQDGVRTTFKVAGNIPENCLPLAHKMVRAAKTHRESFHVYHFNRNTAPAVVSRPTARMHDPRRIL
jgi:hypothetical protein